MITSNPDPNTNQNPNPNPNGTPNPNPNSDPSPNPNPNGLRSGQYRIFSCHVPHTIAEERPSLAASGGLLLATHTVSPWTLPVSKHDLQWLIGLPWSLTGNFQVNLVSHSALQGILSISRVSLGVV